MQKINSLKEEGVRLTDHIAITAKEKAERKAQLIANLHSQKPTESTSKPKNTNV